MLSEFLSFILDIFSISAPEMALAGGRPFRFEDEKGSRQCLFAAKGGGAPPNIQAPPTPPPINLPAPPAPPPPPPPPQMANATDVALARQQSLQSTAGQFGYKNAQLNNGGKDPAQQTGVASLLGNGQAAAK